MEVRMEPKYELSRDDVEVLVGLLSEAHFHRLAMGCEEERDEWIKRLSAWQEKIS
jgi:hypothetical protein